MEFKQESSELLKLLQTTTSRYSIRKQIVTQCVIESTSLCPQSPPPSSSRTNENTVIFSRNSIFLNQPRQTQQKKKTNTKPIQFTTRMSVSPVRKIVALLLYNKKKKKEKKEII